MFRLTGSIPTPVHPDRTTSGIRCRTSRQPTSSSLLSGVSRGTAKSRRKSGGRGAKLSPRSDEFRVIVSIVELHLGDLLRVLHRRRSSIGGAEPARLFG